MKMTDSVIYSNLNFATAPQAPNDHRLQPKASSRFSLSCYVAVALGLLGAVLASLLLFWWILCRGPTVSTCASCPRCPDLWVGHGDRCYYFSVEKKDWNSSSEFCLAKDAHLLKLRDNQEMPSGFMVHVSPGEDRTSMRDLIATTVTDPKFPPKGILLDWSEKHFGLEVGRWISAKFLKNYFKQLCTEVWYRQQKWSRGLQL